MILFTHNDMDAAGSEICIRKAGCNVDKAFYEDYATFPKTVEEIISYSVRNNISNIIIADLSFAEHQKQLQRIVDHFKTVIHLDHHSYPEGFCITHRGNLHQVIDQSRCGCKICYDELKLKNPYLKALTDVIDKFDRWVENNALFVPAFNLNSYFWKIGYRAFVEEFSEKFPDKLNNEIKIINEEAKTTLETLRSSGIIMQSGKTTIQAGDTYFMQSVLDEFKRGQACYVCILNSSLRIRLSQKWFNTDEAVQLRERIVGEVMGHPHAFSYPFKGAKETLFAEITRISSLVELFAKKGN